MRYAPLHRARRRKAPLVRVAAATAVLLGGLVGSGPSVAATPPVTLTLTGNQTQGVRADNNGGTWDLRGAVWNENAPDPIAYPIRSDAWTKGAILGGTVYGNIPKTWTRDQWYNGLDGGRELHGEVYRQSMTDTADNTLLIQDGYAEDFEDAYDPNAVRSDSTTDLEHVRATYIRDDCIENEGRGTTQVPMSVLVRDSLFDGCFTGFAERPPSVGDGLPNGTGTQTFDVEHSLLYVQPQPLGPNYCSTSLTLVGRCVATAEPSVWLGAHGIWKWSSAAASTVVVRNSIFRLDLPSYSGCVSQQWPDGTYQDDVLVWAGPGPYASAGGCANTLPPGVRVTTDVGVWDRAKAAWLAGQPWDTKPPEPSPPPGPGTRTDTRLSARTMGHRVLGTLSTAAGRRLDGKPVLLQRRAAGSSRWSTAARPTSDGSGHVRRTVRPARATWFRWCFRGDERNAPTRSRAVRVLP